MKVLIIDDEKSIRYSLEVSIKKLAGVKVYSAESGEVGLDILRKEHIDLAIIDIKLPGIDGLEVLENINRLKLDITVIMITYISEVRLAVKAMKLGAYDYFTKPFKISEVIDAIKGLEKYISKKGKASNDNNFDIIGRSKSIESIRKIIDSIAKKGANTSVLITGESGTGKEVIARGIAKAFGDGKPFIALNCAAIPKSLQESELFGYEKGAFTEAKERKIGLMEQSNGGILFLDEVGDMDVSLQKKLLRVLQERNFRRVGGRDEIKLEALIVSATNLDLQNEIKLGNFREDLYYRLNIIPVHIEPLRNRKEDIEELLNYFLDYYLKRIDTPIKGISEDAKNVMLDYDWRGNVRELRNIIERIVILSSNSRIEIDDLPKEIFANRDYREKSLLESTERDTINRVLIDNNFNITHTSKELGITRNTLKSKMQRYNIDPPLVKE